MNLKAFGEGIKKNLGNVGKGLGNVGKGLGKGLGNVGKGIGNLVKKNLTIDTKDPVSLTNVTCLILEIFWEEDVRIKNEIEGKFQTDFGTFTDPFTNYTEKKPDDEKRVFKSLHRANHNFVYYLLNTELDELHETYSQFFEEFDDSEKSGLMEQKEFIAMLNLLCKPEYIGKNKLSKCFERLCASCVANSKHIDKLFEGTSTEQLGPNLMNDLFRKFQTEIVEEVGKDKYEKKEVIEYIQFFPFIMAFFSEWIARKIETRKEQILMIRGIAEDEKLEIAKTSSLLSKIKSLGFNYDEKNPIEINYREIEKALILFRNAYSGKLKTEQLTLILDEVKKKYRYDPRTGTFGKVIKLNLNLLTFIAYRICLHSFCSHIYETKKDAKPQEYIEEYSAWAGAVNAKKLSEENLRKKFLRVAFKKVEDLEGAYDQDKIRRIFKFFIKRIIPQMPPKDIDNVLTIYFVANENTSLIPITAFAINLYNLLFFYAKIKLEHYVYCVHNTLVEKKGKDKGYGSGPLEIKETDPRIKEFKMKDYADIGLEIDEINEKMGKKVDNIFQHSPKRKTRKFGTTMVSRSPRKKQTQFADGLVFGIAVDMRNSRNNLEEEKKKAEEKKMASENELGPQSMTEEQLQMNQTLQANMTAMLQRRTALVNEYRSSFISAPPNQGRATAGVSTTNMRMEQESALQNKDVLNSCFIMETFIEKYLFHRKTTGGDTKVVVKQQEEESLDSHSTQNDSRDFTQMTPAQSIKKKMMLKKVTSLAEKMAKNPRLGEAEEKNDNDALSDDVFHNDLAKDNDFDPGELKVVRKADNAKRKGVCDECNIF